MYKVQYSTVQFVCVRVHFGGRAECGVSSSVGYFFSWVWPRVQLILSSVTPALALLSLSLLVLVYAVRLRLRHKRQMMCILMGPSLCAGAAQSVPLRSCSIGGHLELREHQKHQQQLEAERAENARREWEELAHLLPTALAVAISRVIFLSLLLFYAHDSVAVALNPPPLATGTSGSGLSAYSVESSPTNLAHARHVSLALFVAQIALLATHAAALPLAALLISPHGRLPS